MKNFSIAWKIAPRRAGPVFSSLRPLFSALSLPAEPQTLTFQLLLRRRNIFFWPAVWLSAISSAVPMLFGHCFFENLIYCVLRSHRFF
ncbi:MAG TPA: hypothetical protein P5169_05865 [Kiritimatiellia bacterium]|nr:hypothetical protein [Kiritimatiellia bacterium]